MRNRTHNNLNPSSSPQPKDLQRKNTFLNRLISDRAGRANPADSNFTRHAVTASELTDPTLIASRLVRPDTLAPSPYSSTVPLPNTPERQAAFERQLRSVLDAAHARGTLDEDSYDFADGLISSWLGSWLQQLQAEHDGRRHAAAGLIANHVDYQTQLVLTLQSAEEELSSLNTLNSEHIEKLGGTPKIPAPPNAGDTRRHPVQLPPALHLSGLALRKAEPLRPRPSINDEAEASEESHLHRFQPHAPAADQSNN